MKNRPARIFVLVVLVSIFLVSCSPKQQITSFELPAPMPNAEGPNEPFFPWDTFAQDLAFGNQKECWEYYIPSPTPSWKDFLAHYQKEVENQGWVGKPTHVSNDPYTAAWINKEGNTGFLMMYMPDLFQAVVCIGNP
jgi:hypothetical protein